MNNPKSLVDVLKILRYYINEGVRYELCDDTIIVKSSYGTRTICYIVPTNTDNTFKLKPYKKNGWLNPTKIREFDDYIKLLRTKYSDLCELFISKFNPFEWYMVM